MQRRWVESPWIQWLTSGWALAILILSALPGRDLPQVDLIHADKLAHLFVYGVLSMLLTFWIGGNGHKGSKGLSLLIAIAYGALMELMQELFFEERFFDWVDVIANAIGAAIGIVIYRWIR